MKRRVPVALLVLMLTLSAAVSDEPPALRVTTKRSDDRVTIENDANRVVVSIHSPTGISQAKIERTNGAWPARLVLHLHVRGLENLQITSDEIQLGASVSSTGGKTRIWKDGSRETPLDAASPWAPQLRACNLQGEPTTVIPLPSGYFEVKLPPPILQGRSKSITVDWIDFYR